MESMSILRVNPLSFYPGNRYHGRNTSIDPFQHHQWKKRFSQVTHLQCQKMYVPGFGEASPERKAANHLHDFFTYIAVRIVTAQLESYNTEAYKEMMEFLSKHPLNDGDKFCAELMRESPRHKTLALRILEVRSVYCKNDFEWDNLKRLSHTLVEESNTRLMREYVSEISHER